MVVGDFKNRGHDIDEVRDRRNQPSRRLNPGRPVGDHRRSDSPFMIKLEHDRTLFFDHARGSALRHGHWKIVRERKKPWELYNLRVDPLELDDLTKQQPDKLAELTKIWERESKRLSHQAKVK